MYLWSLTLLMVAAIAAWLGCGETVDGPLAQSVGLIAVAAAFVALMNGMWRGGGTDLPSG